MQESRIKIQEVLICPITQDNLKIPVLSNTGQTYEKDFIQNWFLIKDTDPATAIHIPPNQKILIENRFAENLIKKLKNATHFNANDFNCPLTKKLLVDPVTTSEGHTYERSALEAYFASNGDNVDPISQKPIKLIGDEKFVDNFCAKQCIEIYKDDLNKDQEIKQTIKNALEQKDFDILSKVDINKFRQFFYDQSREERKTTVEMLITHLQPELLGYLYDHPPVAIEDDQLFFASFELMMAMSRDVLFPICDPLHGHKDLAGGYSSLSKALKILSDALKQQREKHDHFRKDLRENIENAKRYTREEIIFYIDARDNNNNTLLHLAVESNNLPLIQWLLENSADFKQKNQHGQTPCDYAIANNNRQVVELFIKSGIIPPIQNRLNNQASRLVLEVEALSAGIEYEKTWIFKALKFFKEHAPKLIEFLSSLVPEIDNSIKEDQRSRNLTNEYLKNNYQMKTNRDIKANQKIEIHNQYYPPVLLPEASSANSDFRPASIFRLKEDDQRPVI